MYYGNRPVDPVAHYLGGLGMLGAKSLRECEREKAQLHRMVADARRECRKKGGHLVIRSLQPFDVSCQYFGVVEPGGPPSVQDWPGPPPGGVPPSVQDWPGPPPGIVIPVPPVGVPPVAAHVMSGLCGLGMLGAESAKQTKLIDRRIATAQRACERKKGAFSVSSRLPLRTSCIVPTVVPTPLPTPTPAPTPVPTPTPGAPIVLKKAQINRMVADARRECRKKGGHLVVRSLQPFDVSCEYFGGAPAPVAPPVPEPAPVPVPAPVPAPVPTPLPNYPPIYDPYTGAPTYPGGPPVLTPIDQGFPTGGGFEPIPTGGPGYEPIPGGAPGYEPIPTGGPGYEPIPQVAPGFEEEPTLRTDAGFVDQVPSYQAPGFEPTPGMPMELIDECMMTQPFDFNDDYGPIRVLQVVCAAPPVAGGGGAGFAFSAVPQASIEQSDLYAETGSMPLLGLGRWLG